MSTPLRRRLEKLRANVRRNTPRIKKMLAESGVTPDPAAVFSTAKYYETLKKLAKE